MKMSISLPDPDVDFIDAYADEQGIDSRSAVLQRAVALLRASQLGPAYEDAWSDWSDDDAHLWDRTSGDGIAR